MRVLVPLAIAGGLSGMLGTFLGGYLSDRLGARDPRWYLWVPAIGSAISTPAGIVYYLVDSTAMAIGFQALATITFSMFLGGCLAISHTLVHPGMRAFTSAVLFFILNLIGLGLGPLTTGLVSDWLSADYGANSLRYAMVIVSLIGSVSIPLFFLAAHYLPGDLARGFSGEQDSRA